MARDSNIYGMDSNAYAESIAGKALDPTVRQTMFTGVVSEGNVPEKAKEILPPSKPDIHGSRDSRAKSEGDCRG